MAIGYKYTPSTNQLEVLAPDSSTVTFKNLTEDSNVIIQGDGYVTGDFGIAGKLTVDGLIDPTGLVLDEQSSKPASGTSTKGLIWLRDDGYLVFTDQTNTDRIIDVGGVGSGDGGGVSDHGALTGLNDDDHTQYLLVDGTRAMSGALNMGTNNITNVGTVDGVDISAHGTRHQNGGADEISVAGLSGLLADAQTPLAHGSTHITGGADEVDGDQLDIDWNPTNYTPATTPAEVTSIDHLTAHLYGIDQELSNIVTDHGALTGLGDDDHTQYLLVSGTRSMSGALNMGTFNITNVGTVDGVDISAHGTRHESGGADAIDGYDVAITYTPIYYNDVVNDLVGEHIAAIDLGIGEQYPLDASRRASNFFADFVAEDGVVFNQKTSGLLEFKGPPNGSGDYKTLQINFELDENAGVGSEKASIILGGKFVEGDGGVSNNRAAVGYISPLDGQSVIMFPRNDGSDGSFVIGVSNPGGHSTYQGVSATGMEFDNSYKAKPQANDPESDNEAITISPVNSSTDAAGYWLESTGGRRARFRLDKTNNLVELISSINPLYLGGTTVFANSNNTKGSYEVTVTPDGYNSFIDLADAGNTNITATLTKNAFYSFVVVALARGETSGDYYQAVAEISGSREAGTLTIQGSQTDVSSIGAGLAITLTASSGNLNVNVQNNTGEIINGRANVGWENQNLIPQ